ncbi:hypothetical protein BDR04DRAFT_1088126 [Suillus decipiens]|nr:hypothetical protein BDR04DRAFT_1088126 [Suillus decipiens]
MASHCTYDTSLLFYILCYTIFIILYFTHSTYAGLYVIRHDLHAFLYRSVTILSFATTLFIVTYELRPTSSV